MTFVRSYKELIVWQRSIELATATYRLTSTFPKHEQFGLISQMQRASISIPSNIAEGRCRRTKKDFTRFLHIAYGSGAEIETQMLIAQQLGYGEAIHFKEVQSLLDETMKMLNSMLHRLKAKS